MDCYLLTGVSNRINVSSFFKDSDYKIIARHPYGKSLYVIGPEVRPGDEPSDIKVHRVLYTPPADAVKRSKSQVVRIVMNSDDIGVMDDVDADVIVDILYRFLAALNEKYPLPSGGNVIYTFDHKRYALHVQLPSAECAARACDPNDPVFDAYPYAIDDQIVYMHSLQQTKDPKLHGKLCRKHKLPTIDG